jgi:tetratricopeptide (TPR) repeat protein
VALLGWLLACLPGVAQPGTISWFTDESTFMSSLSGPAFVNDFAGVPPPPVPNPISFSGTAGYSYQATANGGLYRVFGGPFGLTPNDLETPLVFDAFNGITAFGGRFSLTNGDELRDSGSIALSIFTGTSPILLSSTTATVTGAGPAFLGLIYFGAPTPITQATLSTTSAELFPTAERVAVGVPEPSALIALTAGLAMMGLAVRVRRWARKALCAVLALACLIAPVQTTLAAPPQPKKAAVSPTKAALDKAAALVKEGKPEDALAVLRAATLDVKKRRGVGHPDLLPIYDAAGEILVETDPKQKAESLAEKSIAIREKLQADGQLDDEAPLGRTWLLLARARLAAGKLEPALEAATTAVKVLDRTRGPGHDDTTSAWETLERIVVSFEDLLGPEQEVSLAARERLAALDESYGRLAPAIETRRLSLAALRKGSGNESPAATAEFDRLQRLLVESGRADEAIADQEALIETLGTDKPSAPARIEALRLLGEMNVAAERFTAATTAFETALAASEAAFGRNHPSARLDRLNILSVEAARGRAPDAQTVRETVAGPDEEEPSPALARALARAASLLLEGGDAEAARGFASRAIECESAWEAIPPATRIEHRLLLARCLLDTRVTAEARPLLEESLRDAESQVGPGDPRTLRTMAALAECNVLDGLPTEATALLQRVLDRGLPRRDFACDRELARIIGLAARVSPAPAAGAQEPQASSLWDAFVTMRQRLDGDDHPATAHARVLAGGSRLAAGVPQDAIRFLEPAVPALEAARGAEHPDVAGALLILGLAQRDAANTAAAEQSLERALAIWEAKAGESHAATLAATQALALTKVADDRAAEALPLLERLQATYEKQPPESDWRLAEVLVPLATAYLAKADADRARVAATTAAKLDCWQPRRGASTAELEHRALALADVAGILKTVGEESAGTDAQRRARALATRLDNPRAVFTEIDQRSAARN